MAEPWAVIAGKTLSALVGISVIHLVGNPLLAMPMAASLSILGMFMLRCLTPSSSGSFNRGFGTYHALLVCPPVMIDSMLLALAGAVYGIRLVNVIPIDGI